MSKSNFAIRTITAGINLPNLNQLEEFLSTVEFLRDARLTFTEQNYIIQTTRIATQHFHLFVKRDEYGKSLDSLKEIDKIVGENNLMLSIGQILPKNEYDKDVVSWVIDLINSTQNISFSLPISDQKMGALPGSIKACAEIISSIAHHNEGGEGNFRFAAAANCQPDIPYFPVSYHEGKNSFAIGLEYPNVLTELIKQSDRNTIRQKIKSGLETLMFPIQNLAQQLAIKYEREFRGIDTSTAPGLSASIGESIETITRQPFGSVSTLAACAMITDIIKQVKIKRCGYSGLMLPILEDKILAKRVEEKRFSIQELLLYSTVCGTGLDVVPLPGDTPVSTIENLLSDIAALSLKYSDKALSARLFLIPGKQAGDQVSFKNPYLTSSRVMNI